MGPLSCRMFSGPVVNIMLLTEQSTNHSDKETKLVFACISPLSPLMFTLHFRTSMTVQSLQSVQGRQERQGLPLKPYPSLLSLLGQFYLQTSDFCIILTLMLILIYMCTVKYFRKPENSEENPAE